MLIHNKSLDHVFWGIMTYVSGRWYALCIFALLFFWAWYLYKEFHWRATKYGKQKPKEAFLLNLQCRRWERYIHQVLVGIGLSVGIAFLMYLLVEMGKDVKLVAHAKGPDVVQGLNVAYLEALIFVFIFSIKFRALWDAKGVYNDLKESNL